MARWQNYGGCSMFDLEQRIHEWRQTQINALDGRAEGAEELESHLREEVQRLVQSGQTLEHAWQAALRGLGNPQELAAEFARVGSSHPVAWLPARLLLFAQ